METTIHEPRFVIISPTSSSLDAGYRLQELGYKNFQPYEVGPHIGDLAPGFVDSAGFTWDIGGLVTFSHYEYYDELFDKLMGDEYPSNMLECWLLMFGTWVPHLFQNNIRYLYKEACYECLAGIVDAQTKRDHKKQVANFRMYFMTPTTLRSGHTPPR